MPRIPEPDKRAARTLNEANIMDLTFVISDLQEMSGERDPVQLQRILRRVVPNLVTVLNRCHSLEKYHAVAAMRGSYGSGNQDGDGIE